MDQCVYLLAASVREVKKSQLKPIVKVKLQCSNAKHLCERRFGFVNYLSNVNKGFVHSLQDPKEVGLMMIES